MGEVHAAAKVAGLGFGVQGLSPPIVFWVQASTRSLVQYPVASSRHRCSGPGKPQGLASVTFTLTSRAPPEKGGSHED